MTDEQKKQIVSLRSRGVSYTDIASNLQLSRDTVKSYCRRHGVSTVECTERSALDCCEFCGKELKQTEGKKKKRFCSRECCLNWWHNHPESINKKAVYSFRCACCGKEFTSYGNAKRKYCSHECYIADRFKKGGSRE